MSNCENSTLRVHFLLLNLPFQEDNSKDYLNLEILWTDRDDDHQDPKPEYVPEDYKQNLKPEFKPEVVWEDNDLEDRNTPEPIVCDYVWNRSRTKLIRDYKKPASGLKENICGEEYFNLCKLGSRAKVNSEDEENSDENELKKSLRSRTQYQFIKRPPGGIYTRDIPLSKPEPLDKNDQQCDLVWNESRSCLLKRCSERLITQDKVEEPDETPVNKPTVATPVDQEEFKCRFCDLEVGTYMALVRHLSRVHQAKPDKCVLCFICAKTFASHKSVTTHIKQIHGGGESAEFERKKKMCEVCSAEVANMSQHMLVHGAPNKTCELCGKAFRRNQDLKTHMTAVHENLAAEKLHSCQVCGKTFNMATYLKRHMRTHSQDKPYKCVCGDGFNFNVSLKAHKTKCVEFLNSVMDDDNS